MQTQWGSKSVFFCQHAVAKCDAEEVIAMWNQEWSVFFFATAGTQVIILQVASDGSMFCHLSTYSSSGSLSPLLTAPPLSTHGRWPADLPAARAGGRLLQGHREDRGLPGLDHRHRREG